MGLDRLVWCGARVWPGAIAVMADMVMPTDPMFEKPHRAYVTMLSERSVIGSNSALKPFWIVLTL